MKINKGKIIETAIMLFLLLFIVISIVAYFKVRSYRKQLEENKLELQIYRDSLIVYKNTNNENVARIGVLQAENTKFFLSLESKDEVIQKLQTQVAYYKKKLKEGGSVTVIGTETEVDTVIKIVHDTITEASSFIFSDKWINLSGNIFNDSLAFKLGIINEYTLFIGYDKNKAYVELTNHNPYNTTKYLRTYEVKLPDPPKWNFGFQAGLGVTVKGIYPYLGIGVQRTILRL